MAMNDANWNIIKTFAWAQREEDEEEEEENKNKYIVWQTLRREKAIGMAMDKSLKHAWEYAVSIMTFTT